LVSFTCADDESGLASGSPPPDRLLSAEAAGQSVTGTCTDLAGNSASATVAGISIDKTPPVLTCGVASGAWRGTDASIACSVADGVSGVALASDVNFTLTTSVAPGTETADACTSMRQVCDRADNCSAAGPLCGNRVDKKSPTIALVRPEVTIYQLNQQVTAQYSCADAGSGVRACAGPVATGAQFDTASAGTKTFVVTATDNVGNASSLSRTYVVNAPPTVTVGADVTLNEGDTLARSGSFTDPDANVWTVTVDFGDGSQAQLVGINPDKTFGFSHVYADDGRFTVTMRVSDDAGGVGTARFVVTVSNLPPAIVAVDGPMAPLGLGAAADVKVTFTDRGVLDTHTCTFDWDDGSTQTVAALGSGGAGSCTAMHTYAAAGVYTVRLSVTDDDTGSARAAFEYVVIYDPQAGFVTGGGWFNSRAGAFTADPSLAGRASFGFNSRYQKGATTPAGETEFQFRVASFNFHSTAYEWLVVSGPKAQYKGVGTVNGAGDYGFLLTATDGQLAGGGGADKFRIKVWDRATGVVVYDNVLGAADDIDGASPQDIAAGSIVIHSR
jgi:hypothetical protein